MSRGGKDKNLAANTISTATILQAVVDLNEQGIEHCTTGQIGEQLLRPERYDMGNRLFNLTKNPNPYLMKESDGSRNAYYITDKGKAYLKANRHLVQEYGCYEVVGKDKKVKELKPTGAALAALEELQQLIQDNLEAKLFVQNLIADIEEFLGENL